MDVREAKLGDLERLIAKYNRRAVAYRTINYTLLIVNSIIPAISSVLFTGTLGEQSSTAGIVLSIVNMVLATLERKLRPGKRERAYRALLAQARALKYQLLDDNVDPKAIKLSTLYQTSVDDAQGDDSAV